MGLIKKLFAFFIIIFAFTGIPVFPQQENASVSLSLNEIDLLIKQTEYDDALRALSAYIKEYPEDLDAAQRRIDRIMNARSYYTRLAGQLLDVMENEPENAEKKLAIINQLETLEKHPSEEHLAFIRQAKAAAEFTYYRAKFRRIMEQGARYAETRNYLEGVDLIKTGFYMYRDEFYEENPASVSGEVTRTVDGLNTSAQEYSDGQKAWSSAYEKFIQAVESGSYQNALREWTSFSASMKRFSVVRNSLAASGLKLQVIFERLKKNNPDLTEASYLSFMRHFSNGSESIPNSGILGIMDCQWTFMMENAKSVLYKTVRQKFSDFLNSAHIKDDDLVSSKTEPQRSFLTEAQNFARLSDDVNNLYSLLENTGYSKREYPGYRKSMQYAQALVPGTNSSLDNLSEYKDALARLSVTDAKDIDGLHTLVSRLEKSAARGADNLSAQWFTDYTKSYESQSATSDVSDGLSDGLLDWTEQNDYYKTINSLLMAGSKSAVASIWNNLADLYASSAREIEAKYQGLYDEATSLAKNHYPAEALESVRKIRADLDSDRRKLVDMQRDLSSQSAVSTGAKDLQNIAITAAIASLDEYERQGRLIERSARQESLLATSAQNRADEVYRSAERNYRNGNYISARDNLQQARELYNEALSRQESETLRSTSDRNLSVLGAQINEAENRIVVTEVRQLKTRAKNDFYAGNFDSAESLLNRAETRWAVTNIEPDEEIVNLKLLVKNALSMKTGREIKPTAPLYPEMSQILSNAHQYFDQGAALIKKGRREEAVALLNEAKKKLQELQRVYPLNQEAALLTLRIDELIDPASFNEIFARRVKAAESSVKVASTQQQGYSDLLDLYEIRPNYPGLRKFIYDIEIDLGIRQKPVDQSGRRKSYQLTAQAELLYNRAKGNEEILRQALSRLDEAISLNPDNESAIMLKDRIQIAVGGKAAVVLSGADEASYNEAIQKFQRGDINGANAIVERLLQNVNNRRSSKILDLQKQVQARL